MYLVRTDEALGEERPDGAHYGEHRGDGDEEVGEEALAGGDLVSEEAEVEGEGKALAVLVLLQRRREGEMSGQRKGRLTSRRY